MMKNGFSIDWQEICDRVWQDMKNDHKYRYLRFCFANNYIDLPLDQVSISFYSYDVTSDSDLAKHEIAFILCIPEGIGVKPAMAAIGAGQQMRHRFEEFTIELQASDRNEIADTLGLQSVFATEPKACANCGGIGALDIN
jgi:hypothetical protein